MVALNEFIRDLGPTKSTAELFLPRLISGTYWMNVCNSQINQLL